MNSKQPKDSSTGKWLAIQVLYEYNTAGNERETDLFTYVDSQNEFLRGGGKQKSEHIYNIKPPEEPTYFLMHLYVHRKTSGRLHRKPSTQDRKWEMVVKKASCKRRRRKRNRWRENKREPGLVLAWMPIMSFVAPYSL